MTTSNDEDPEEKETVVLSISIPYWNRVARRMCREHHECKMINCDIEQGKFRINSVILKLSMC